MKQESNNRVTCDAGSKLSAKRSCWSSPRAALLATILLGCVGQLFVPLLGNGKANSLKRLFEDHIEVAFPVAFVVIITFVVWVNWCMGRISGIFPKTRRDWIRVTALANFVAFLLHLIWDRVSGLEPSRFAAGHYLIVSHGHEIALTPIRYWFSFFHGILFFVIFLGCIVAKIDTWIEKPGLVRFRCQEVGGVRLPVASRHHDGNRDSFAQLVSQPCENWCPWCPRRYLSLFSISRSGSSVRFSEFFCWRR